ncbi:acetyltransferase [Collimonas antrihumi]|uniref:acetyltransferase n=1 Tax=Collimonas antrihumi TaxID=1940615 RepID=UPI001B8B2E17|nr:acetyltransferase [Collimonas antrihumi]
MSHYYAFNGDADGLCALQQLRLAEPHLLQQATLVTGVKRDIKLLQRIDAEVGDEITVLDISHDQNRADVLRLIQAGASLRYFDHHHAGELPRHPCFAPYIEEAAEVCTSILVDRYLDGRHRYWAIVAAFGDSLPEVANAMARAAGLDLHQAATLERLGICLNYNAYGETVADLHFDPVDLAESMLPFTDPLMFAAHSEAYARLAAGYEEDMCQARRLAPLRQVPGAMLMRLPDEAWARRAIGVFANELMLAQPDCALGILSPQSRGGFTVSVRVPTHSPVGAADFCRAFDTGGGRKLAGGINHLPANELERFAGRFEACFGMA